MNGKQQYDLAKVDFDEVYSAVIPPEDPLYEPFGNYYDVERITVRGTFFPYWIYGLSGNGKTLSIEQAHARNKKRLVNIPITREADEDSLLGGLRLDNGSTVPFFGPITLAAILGVTANLDEIDLGDERLMCLQTAMQNRPFLIKRLGLMIYPQAGFNITSTMAGSSRNRPMAGPSAVRSMRELRARPSVLLCGAAILSPFRSGTIRSVPGRG